MDSSNSPTQPLQPAPAQPRWRSALRWFTSPRALLGATGFLTLVAVAVGAAWILPPSNVAGDFPGDESLGTLAKQSIKANRDYAIEDPEATDARRAEAAARVRPVYDLDLTTAETARAHLTAAFRLARESLEESLPDPSANRRNKQRRESDQGMSDDMLVAAAEPFRSEFIKALQAVIDPAEYKELAKLRFSESLESAAISLTRGVLAGEIAPSRELLLAERNNGITVRRLSDGYVRSEAEIRDIERIPDVLSVRTDLLRLSQGLPEIPNSNSGVARVAMALSPEVDSATKRAAAMITARLVMPNLAYNDRATEERKRAAAESVKPIVLQYSRGEKVVSDGERIEKRHVVVFRYIRDQARALDWVQVRLGAALFTALLVVSIFALARKTVRRFRPSKRDLVFLAAALLGNLALLRITLALSELFRDRIPQLSYDVVVLALPLAAGTMLVRMLRSGESSVVFALIFTPLAGILLASHTPAAIGLVASVIAADQLGRRTGRRSLPLASVHSGLAAALAVLALSLYNGRLIPETAYQIAAAAVGAGVLSPLIALLVAPLFEFLFGYISESQLAKLASLNHPVLKELIIKAPGTYHHSLIVGALAEAAAKRVGAHPVLARVGGYFHDLGKAESPLFFGENQKAENRLERLPAAEAAAMLRRHVNDGVARAQSARLPKAVQEFILQHHGTARCGGFYSRAVDEAQREGREPPDPRDFHYDGPKPRSREVALVMLADAVEAASRSLENPTPQRLQALVPKVIEQILLAGQLDDCDLTLADLRLASVAFEENIVELHGLSRVEVLPGMRPMPVGPAATEAPIARVAR